MNQQIHPARLKLVLSDTAPFTAQANSI